MKPLYEKATRFAINTLPCDLTWPTRWMTTNAIDRATSDVAWDRVWGLVETTIWDAARRGTPDAIQSAIGITIRMERLEI